MAKFDKALLADIKSKVFQKEAFIPSPQMQQQIVQAQQAGAVPPDPGAQQAGADGGSQIGLDQLGQMMQSGFDGLNQALQQLAQMIQQSAQAPAEGGKEKKLSTTERIDRLEQMVQQAMGGGAAPQDPAAAGAGAPPPQDPAAAGAPPQDPAAAAGAPPAQ